MKTKNKTATAPITVGGYEIIRKGSRLIFQHPACEEEKYDGWGRMIGMKKVPAQIETAISLSKAKELLELPAKELARADRIDELEEQIAKLNDQIFTLESEVGQEMEVGGYTVTADGYSVEFGCTTVDESDLAAIRKLVNQKAK